MAGNSSFLFGGNTGLTQADIQNLRRQAAIRSRSGTRPANNTGQGLANFGNSISGALIERRARGAETANNEQFNSVFADLFAQRAGGQSAPPPGVAQDELGTQQTAVGSPPSAPQGQGFNAQSAIDLLGQSGGNSGQRELLQELISRKLGLGDQQQPTALIQNYQEAIRGGFGGSFFDYQTELKKAGRSSTSVNVNAGQRGIPVPEFSKLPAGLVYKRDANGQVFIDQDGAPQAIQIPGTTQADDRNEKIATKVSEVDKAGDTLATIRRLKNHPGQSAALGPIQGRLPTLTEDVADFRAIKGQVVGAAFLEALKSGLKGTGQITEIEGTKATSAITALDDDLISDAEFNNQIDILEGVVVRNNDRIRNDPLLSQEGIAGSTPQTGQTPKQGEWVELPGGVRIRQKAN